LAGNSWLSEMVRASVSNYSFKFIKISLDAMRQMWTDRLCITERGIR